MSETANKAVNFNGRLRVKIGDKDPLSVERIRYVGTFEIECTSYPHIVEWLSDGWTRWERFDDFGRSGGNYVLSNIPEPRRVPYTFETAPRGAIVRQRTDDLKPKWYLAIPLAADCFALVPLTGQSHNGECVSYYLAASSWEISTDGAATWEPASQLV